MATLGKITQTVFAHVATILIYTNYKTKVMKTDPVKQIDLLNGVIKQLEPLAGYSDNAIMAIHLIAEVKKSLGCLPCTKPKS